MIGPLVVIAEIITVGIVVIVAIARESNLISNPLISLLGVGRE